MRAFAHLGDDEDSGDEVALDDGTDAPAGAADATPGVKIVQENVSSIAKSPAGVALDAGYQERIIAVDKPENLRAVFEDNAITGDDADEIIAALSQLIDVSRLRPGQKIRVAFATDPATAGVDQPNSDADSADDSGDADAGGKAAQSALRPIRVSIYDNGAHQATVARADNNVFVRADEPSTTPELFAETPVQQQPEAEGGPPRLYDALYETALAQQVPAPLIDDLIRAFAYDVDYTSRVSPGDSLEVFHSLPDPHRHGGRRRRNPLRLAHRRRCREAPLPFPHAGRQYRRLLRRGRAQREEVPGAQAADHQRPHLLAVRLARPSDPRLPPPASGRRLCRAARHARSSPPATGVVERAGPSNGYGNFTLIKHTNGYETAYGHQTAFAKGIVPGVFVHQGQVIGFVGSTGLSTGPHLHFEIRVNGQPVDPLRIRLPRGRILDGTNLDTFEQERDRIDALFGNSAPAPQTVASLDTGTD